jgi:hypothetical protein
MQDKSAPGGGFTLRVAASFNIAVKTAPSGRSDVPQAGRPVP